MKFRLLTTTLLLLHMYSKVQSSCVASISNAGLLDASVDAFCTNDDEVQKTGINETNDCTTTGNIIEAMENVCSYIPSTLNYIDGIYAEVHSDHCACFYDNNYNVLYGHKGTVNLYTGSGVYYLGSALYLSDCQNDCAL